MLWQQFTLIFGGLGLFLLGMTFMTDGLKSMAGESLRSLLARFTRGRISAVTTGLCFTAAVQSSSVTTLAAIGFVNAGLLTLPQVLGILYGANLGTTLTGWMVSLLGIKIQAAAFALPMIGLGAILKLVGRDRLQFAGLAMAGFGLLFLGIDSMQAGMAQTGQWTFLDAFTADNIFGRLVLVGIGMLMTIVMQSSSAAFAVTLTAVSTGSIEFADAAALSIGQNVGTTFKAMLASIGGTSNARRAATAHVLFNVLTGAIPFLLLGPFLYMVSWFVNLAGATPDPTILLAAFHTAFNVLGILIMTPLIPRTARMLEGWFQSESETLGKPRYLDSSVLTVPGTAVEAVDRELDHLRELVVQTGNLAAQIDPNPSVARQQFRQHEAVLAGVDSLTGELQSYLEKLERSPRTEPRVFAFLRTLEHLNGAAQVSTRVSRLRARLGHPPEVVATKLTIVDATMREAIELLRHKEISRQEQAELLAVTRATSAESRERLRRSLFVSVAHGEIPTAMGMAVSDYVTAVDSLVYHLARAVHYWSGGDPAEPVEAEPPTEAAAV